MVFAHTNRFRAEDPQYAHMSREDVRLRFFTPMRELKHALAARLSHGL